MAVTRTTKRVIREYGNPITMNYVQTLLLMGLARPSSTKMVAGAFYIPKHNPSMPLGQDSHFILPGAHTVGVADGVGGWSKRGIDAGIYARELMRNAVLAIRRQLQSEGSVDPTAALDEAYVDTDEPGSSTACILTLVDDVVRAVNVGDSGFVILRGGRVCYRTPVQQTRFNCPVQLGRDSDDSSVAEEIEVAVEPGDVVVMATDGLFDNVHQEELERLVQEDAAGGGIKNPGNLAAKIARYALRNAINGEIETPFSVESRKAGVDPEAVGGKYDDITVIVAYIMRPSKKRRRMNQ
ncbi:unnamed protein product [Cuscuta epithymum]|uniref:Protein phosphatase n=1 Tax=Cuscuta epithymum TaxID=186058 RepID=A0AAV0EVR5_9ASTE|nr:unnamed protein product [Cuscuta epithymum]